MWDERLLALLNTLPVGVFVVDAAGVLREANRPGLALLKVDPEVVGRRPLADLLPDEALGRALAAPPNGAVRVNLARGERALHAEVRPLPGGTGEEKLVVVRDVTDLSPLMVLRKNFFFDLLHKLRTPLTTIVSVLSMMSSGRLDPSTVDLGEITSMGAREAERLTVLLSHLKDLFLVETNALEDELDIEPVPVVPCVIEVAGTFRDRFAARNQALVEKYAEGTGKAYADREVLKRVLDSVFRNAHLYTPSRGTVIVRTQRLPGHVRILVQDDGPGIPREDLAGLFRRFRRGQAEYVRSVEGEGLGLYLARRLLLAMNGTILVDSRPGAGTAVEIALEAAGEDA